MNPSTAVLIRRAAAAWRRQLADRINYANGPAAVAKYPEAARIAALLELDLAGLEAAAAAAIPEPKAWARLNADGTPKAAKQVHRKDAKDAKRKPKAGKRTKASA